MFPLVSEAEIKMTFWWADGQGDSEALFVADVLPVHQEPGPQPLPKRPLLLGPYIKATGVPRS